MILRTILLAVWLSIAIVATAQEAQVQRFFLDPTDLEGQVRERLDGNGDRCALIKVQSAIPCEFNGDIVGNVAKVKGSYLVYVCAKDNFTRSIDIIPEGYLPMTVTFADFGINEIKGGQTYILRIETMTPADSNRAKDEGANYLVINITPKTGAIVKINGQPATVKDGSVSKFLKYGTYTYSVEAEGYEQQSGEVAVTKGGKTIKDIKLRSLLATLTILPETPGCKISIDGEYKGEGHWTGRLTPGLYRVECSKPGYRDRAESVELGKSEYKEIKIGPLTPSFGNLNVNYAPAGAKVEIDGKQAGMTPDVFRDIHSGKHTIIISKDGYATQRKEITITEGETLELNGGLVEDVSGSYSKSTDDGNEMVYDYIAVDLKPWFPGDDKALSAWISKHLNYPPDAQEEGAKGRVVIDFIVKSDGSIGRVMVKRSSGNRSLDREAVRVIKTLPQFTPGKKYGKPVNVWYSVPINFR